MKQNKSKCCIFSRTSTTKQDIEQQSKALFEEAKRLGYSKENQILIEYQESGIKLGIDERIGIQKLKQAIIEDKSIDCVICWELTRIARRADIIYNIRDFLLEHKIRWIVCKPYMELIDNSGILPQVSSLMLGIFTSFAESEMAIKKERFTRAKNELRQQGKKFGGSVIFGYMKNKDKYIELHPTHSQMVSAIFAHYVEDKDASLYSTYMWANSKYPDVFPVLPYTKAQRKMKHLFDTPVYWEGNWCYPPIITEELHNKAAEKAKKSRCLPRFESKNNWLGRGRLYCKHCGNMLTPVAGITRAYNCSTDKEHSVTINIDAIEWLLWEEAKVAANIKAMTSNVNTIVMTQNKLDEKKKLLEQYENNIIKIQEKQQKLVNLYIEGKITKEIFDNQNSNIIEDLNTYNIKKDKTNAEITELLNILDTPNTNTSEKINYEEVNNFDTKLNIVREVIDRVWVDKIDIKKYSLKFEYKGVIVPQVGNYIYVAKNQYKRIYRINQDKTEDLIYEDAKKYKRDENRKYKK